jgi:hypothetical protein
MNPADPLRLRVISGLNNVCDEWDTKLENLLKYFKVAKRLLSDESFKSRCIQITEQIISAKQKIELSSNSEIDQLKIEAINLQIKQYKAELSDLLQEPYDCLPSLLLRPGNLFSEEQMKAERMQIIKTINKSWAAIQEVKQNLLEYEESLKGHPNITHTTYPIRWIDNRKSEICDFEQRINRVMDQNNELNAILWADERVQFEAKRAKTRKTNSKLVFLL